MAEHLIPHSSKGVWTFLVAISKRSEQEIHAWSRIKDNPMQITLVIYIKFDEALVVLI